jgi:hypothetical protein
MTYLNQLKCFFNFCLIIPTYPPHFKYVNKLLCSIDKFKLDKDVTNIYLIISKNDYDNSLIGRYNTINIIVLFLEDIIFDIFTNLNKSEENINSAKNLINYCDKFSFQSIKKILSVKYAVSYLKYDYVYVLDSEGLFIRPFSINSIFNEYLKNKRIFYNSKHRLTHKRSILSKDILNTNIHVPGWLLENYLWIYEKKIIDDFFESIFTNIFKVTDITNAVKEGTFIEIVYYHFIFINNNKYNYEFIDIHELMKKYLNAEKFENITGKHYSIGEDIRQYLSPEIVENISNFYKDYNIINFKIRVNDININFIKNTKSIICINSGDFPINFDINFNED